MTPKVLITGGAGFIGSHLAELYLNRGLKVCVVDDLSTGSLQNIRHLTGHPRHKKNLSVTVDSIMNERIMKPLIRSCDPVIHLAAAVGVRYILNHPLNSIHTNIVGTNIVLKLCNEYRKRVLIASTSEVYGKQEGAPLSEDSDVTFGSSGKIRWSYAVAKLMDELTALAYFKTTGLEIVIARLFNTVGKRQTGEYGMVIPRLVQQALRNEPLTVFGDGTQTRTFTGVDEVCVCLAELLKTHAAFGQVVNVGGVEEISIKDLAVRIIEKTNSQSAVQMVPYEQAYSSEFEDMPRRVPCTAKLQKLIGFTPKKALNQMLDEIINAHRTSSD